MTANRGSARHAELRGSILLPPAMMLWAVAGEAALTLSWPGTRLHSRWWLAVGVALIGAGFGLMGWAHESFRRRDVPIHPFANGTTLLTTGAFALSRNPMYAGMVVMLLGTALALRSGPALLAAPLFAGLVRQRFILREERALRERFGQTYEDYARRVRRWI